jgi:hypothetical protein
MGCGEKLRLNRKVAESFVAEIISICPPNRAREAGSVFSLTS